MRNHVMRAFTLIELLIVVSIMSLLIALLLPALRKGRVAAKVVQGLSQARQVQVGIAAYSNDCGGYMPYASQGNEADKGPYWTTALLGGGYVGRDPEIFYTPDHDRTVSLASNLKFSGFGANAAGPMPTLYTSAGTLLGRRPYRYGAAGHPLPSEQLTIADASFPSQYAGGFGDGYFSATHQSMFTYGGQLTRAYADGHGTNSDSMDVLWLATGPRTGFFDLDRNGLPGGPSILFHWAAPWYGRSTANATY